MELILIVPPRYIPSAINSYRPSCQDRNIKVNPDCGVAKEASTMDARNHLQSPLLSLPAEIRVAILEYVYESTSKRHGLIEDTQSVTLLDEDYAASKRLSPLLTCRTLYNESYALGISSTTYLMTSLFGDAPQRLSSLQPDTLQLIRSFTFVADARQFRKLVDWHLDAFDTPALQLDTLTIVLHRSSFWHYLFDYTEGVVKLLRILRNVKRLVIVRNNARVKGSFKTWNNRLIGHLMKTDHFERYDRFPACLEQVWWNWSFDDTAQTICLDARPPKPVMEENAYMDMILPFMRELTVAIENEEYNPDPRSRNMYY